ncbi:alpha/beta hydrolase [Nonomuraea zeae]|uniref:Alpha/beta hydrolase n=1 Tax=Nonomuraea zeae TaxID=1642303 RepID=A0A5S4FP12_9ACTN|nr:alpha/beta hydrolase [Nonomuraea zeae]TMR22416.1 alpha/beta hydrolase [Nonomuraea zeae]
MSANPTYVFVHGSGSNSFLWTPLMRELALLGHRTLAVDLPGHGFDAQYPTSYQAPQDLHALAAEPSRLAAVTLQDNVDHVAGIVRRVAEHGPVILVGASLGGLTISRVGNAVPDLISRIVYLSAWCCVKLPSLADYLGEPEFAAQMTVTVPPVGDPAALGAVRVNWRAADPGFLADARHLFMADATDDQFRVFLNTLQPDSSMAVLTADARVDAATWGTIPRTYIRLTEDRTTPVAFQDRMIAEADELTPGNPFDVHSVESSHAGFILKGAEVAAILARLA